MDLKEFFITNARVSRRALARFLDVNKSSVDEIADDLDFGDRLSLEDAQDVVFAHDEQDSEKDDADDDGDEEE